MATKRSNASEATLQVGQPVREFLGYFTAALLGFAAIGVVVGAFIIFNTFTILVAQRTRELGLLRAMGASGAQVVRSVVLEALMVGAVASAVGLALGVALGVGLLQLLREIGFDLPRTTTVLLQRTDRGVARRRSRGDGRRRRCGQPCALPVCHRSRRSTTCSARRAPRQSVGWSAAPSCCCSESAR